MKYAIPPRIVNFSFVGIRPYAKICTILKLFALLLLLLLLLLITIFKHGTISQYIKYLQKRKEKE